MAPYKIALLAMAAIAFGCSDEGGEPSASRPSHEDAGQSDGMSTGPSAGAAGSDASVVDAGASGAGATDAGSDAGSSEVVPEARSCVDQHPRGPALDAQQLADAVSQCQIEWRLCTAAAPCNGMDKDHLCDADRFISKEAAICIAHTAGLAVGLYGPLARLAFDNHVVWNVQNTLHDDTHGAPRGESDGAFIEIDAISGEASEIGSWRAIP